jgi:hypothetical protein
MATRRRTIRRNHTRATARTAAAHLRGEVYALRTMLMDALEREETEAGARKIANAIGHADEAMQHLDKAQLALK